MKYKFPTEALKLGMYVSELDRPWVETPFLFQGFYLKEVKEIETLQDHCQYVLVDSERCKIDPATIKWLQNNEARQSQLEFLIKKPQSHEIYHDKNTVKEEIGSATEVHANASSLMQIVMDDVRSGKKINNKEIEHVVNNMCESILRNPDAFMWLRRLKKTDSYSYTHAIDSCSLAIAFGRHLGLPKNGLRQLGVGVMLADIGKNKLPEELLKRPGKLTDDEFSLIQKHVEYGVKILQSIEGMDAHSIDVVHCHHERHNGKGYPRKLFGKKIPVFGRIAAIVDCFDAITTDRAYAKAISPHDATRRLYEWRNEDFQEELVEQFIQSLGVYPTGTLVELNTGQVGIVISQNRSRRLKPTIMLVLDEHKIAYKIWPTLDLLAATDKEDEPIEITSVLEPGAYGVNPADFYL